MASIQTSIGNAGYVRPTHGRMIGGVCAGLARKWGMDPNVVRLLFVVSCVLPGPQFLLYAGAWLLMPEAH